MAYQLKRVDPFWHTHPMIPTAVVIGGILGFIGYARQSMPIAVVGGAVAALALFFAARPSVSLVLATVGFLGGLVQYVVAPGLNASTLTLLEKIFSIAFYTVFYAALMDAVVLVLAVLYNFYAGAVGFGGIRVELDTVEDEPAA